MKKIHLSSLFFILFAFTTYAQKSHSCCSMPSTQQFALLSNNAAFTASHLAPLPFEYVSEKGKKIHFACADGKEASAFKIEAEMPGKNVLFVIHEWWGLNDYIQQECEKLQQQVGNTTVIALDLYDGKVASIAEEASKYMGEANEERIKSIINGALAYVGKDAKIQTIGWCFGGGWSLQASILAGKQSVGCVIYYGMPEKDEQKIKTISSPVLGIFASQDNWITKDIVTDFEKSMKANKKQIEINFFEAAHAFANPSNPKFNKEAAEKANKMAIDFLKKNSN